MAFTVVSIGHIMKVGYLFEFDDSSCKIRSDGFVIGSIPASSNLNMLFNLNVEHSDRLQRLRRQCPRTFSHGFEGCIQHHSISYSRQCPYVQLADEIHTDL